MVEQGWLVVELEWCSVEAGAAVVVAAARGGELSMPTGITSKSKHSSPISIQTSPDEIFFVNLEVRLWMTFEVRLRNVENIFLMILLQDVEPRMTDDVENFSVDLQYT